MWYTPIYVPNDYERSKKKCIECPLLFFGRQVLVFMEWTCVINTPMQSKELIREPINSLKDQEQLGIKE